MKIAIDQNAKTVSLPARGSALHIEGIDFAYGNIQVLFGVELEVRRDEIFVLIGPNGAGKTTLLRVVAGLETARAGRVELDDHDVSYLDTEARVVQGLGVVFGGGAVFGDLTVDANLRAGGQLLAKDPATLAGRIEEAYGLFPRLADRRLALGVQLSGGEQQMLALAKAFLLKPRLLCIDELSMGLAPVLVGRLLEALKALNAAGTTLLLVEQSVNVALSVADRIGYFERGEVRAVLEAEDARRQPELLHRLFLRGQQT